MKDRIKITLSQMNILLVGVEYGFRQCEKNKNLEAALAGVYELYEVVRPDAQENLKEMS